MSDKLDPPFYFIKKIKTQIKKDDDNCDFFNTFDMNRDRGSSIVVVTSPSIELKKK